MLSSNQTPPLFQKWGPYNEDTLKQLKQTNIDWNDTAIGWQNKIGFKKMATLL